MIPTLIVACGTTGIDIVSRAEELIRRDLNRLPECVKILTIDADFSSNPDILLDRVSAEKLLENPSGFGLEIEPETNNLLRTLKNSSKGALLSRKLARILTYVSAERISTIIRQAYDELQRGMERENERGELSISNRLVINIVSSAVGGVGSTTPVETTSIAKYNFPDAQINFITSFCFCSAGTLLPQFQFEKAKRNASELVRELIAIEEERIPATFYPYLRNGYFQFHEFRVKAAAPDMVFDIRPTRYSLDRLKDDSALFIRDLILRGIPHFREGVENKLAHLEGNVISVTVQHYEFPKKEVEEYIKTEGFKKQIHFIHFSAKIDDGSVPSILREDTLLEVFGSMHVKEPPWEDFLEELKEGKASLEKIRHDLEESIEEVQNRLIEKREKAERELEESLMKKIEAGRIGEALASIVSTEKYLAGIDLSKPKSEISLEEVEKEFEELRKLHGTSFVLFKLKKIERKAASVLRDLKKYYKERIKETTIATNSETKRRLMELLESKRNSIEALLNSIKMLESYKPSFPDGRHIKCPSSFRDLVVPSFELSMDLDEMRNRWSKLVSNKIEEKVIESFKPDLSAFRFDGIDEGWYVPPGEKAKNKDRLTVAILPPSIDIRGKEHVEQIVRNSGLLEATVYRFVFGISLREIQAG